jgi:tRNA(Ile)-lysidine synthase
MPKVLQADDSRVARFDLDALDGGLSVRWPQAGDRYRPIGLHGTKKLFDLLADRKVPSFERPLVPIVVDHQGILWPVGHPIAHRARLTNRTRRVLEARLEEASWKSRS